MGIPGKPGGDALNRRLEQLKLRKERRQGTGMTRPDLGTVTNKPTTTQPEQSTLGTLSSLLFGRKGGLF